MANEPSSNPMDVKTYRAKADPSYLGDEWLSAVMEPHPEGQWVHVRDYERLTRERDEANRKHAMVTAALKEEAAENDRLRAALLMMKHAYETDHRPNMFIIEEALRPAGETKPVPCCAAIAAGKGYHMHDCPTVNGEAGRD